MSEMLAPGWRGSPAQLFLLGSFLEPGKPEGLTTRLDWEGIFGQAPEQVLEQFLSAGLLEYVDQGQPLARRLEGYTVKDLQDMLRARGLPVSGRKDELVSRLIEADPGGMEEAARTQSALRCSEPGREAVAEYLAVGQVEMPPSVHEVQPSEPEPGPVGAEEHVRRGLNLGGQGDLEGALVEFDRAIERDAGHARAYYWRGVVLERLGDYPRALVGFHQAIALEPAQADAYVGRGDAYRKLGQYRMAVLEYNAAVERDPGLAMAYHNRGVAYECQGDYQRALADYEKAARLSPDTAEPCFGRGVVYAHAGDYQRAAEQFEKAIQLAEDAQVRAWAMERLGAVQMVL